MSNGFGLIYHFHSSKPCPANNIYCICLFELQAQLISMTIQYLIRLLLINLYFDAE
jgi:hypothetical protein